MRAMRAMITNYGELKEEELQNTNSPKWDVITRQDFWLLIEHKVMRARLICWDTGTAIVFGTNLSVRQSHKNSNCPTIRR